MKDIPKSVAELVEADLPDFVKAVHSDSAENIMMMLDAFAGESELFYSAIWYATSHGKNVLIVSKEA